MWALSVARADAGVNGQLTDILMLADRSLRLMQCGLVFFLLLFNTYLGIPHRSMLFGISLGFGFFAAVNMLVATGASQQHLVVRAAILSRINGGAYLMAVLIWVGYTLASAPSQSRVREEVLLRSKDWNSALEEARVVPADSLLDSMDRTVERLLYPPEEAKIKVASGGSSFHD
jgi:hypothetical protein